MYKAKEIEENNRMGKTRNLFKKIGDSTGTFHARMGMIKEKYGKDLIEAANIKKRWQEYTDDHTVQVSCSVMSDSLQPHESQNTRPPCPSPTPEVH